MADGTALLPGVDGFVEILLSSTKDKYELELKEAKLNELAVTEIIVELV